MCIRDSFEEDVLEITRLAHEAGALVYYDGANLNAIMGKTRPGDMGMDVVHMNLHKTFSTPHGGGGPGAGPLAVCARLEPYLPAPLVSRRDPNEAPMRRADCREGCASGPDDDGACCPRFGLDYDRPASIGRVRGFYGNVGVLVRAYAYILSMGGDGLTQASEDAVINANYLRTRIGETYPVPYDRICMHEFVASAAPLKKDTGINARDVAKRILDFGIHAPTVYFPLIVPDCLLYTSDAADDLTRVDL